jgi:plasmid stability protein
MGSIQVREVPDDEHEAVRRRAASAGLTVGDYVLGLIRNDLQVPLRQDWMDRVAKRGLSGPLDVAEALRQSRESHGDREDGAV